MQKKKKKKILEFQTKNVLFFRLKIAKSDCDIWNHSLDFSEMQKIVQNIKKTNLGPKIPCLHILVVSLKKVLSYFQHPRICQTAKFRAKLKVFNFGTKIPDLGVFRLQF